MVKAAGGGRARRGGSRIDEDERTSLWSLDVDPNLNFRDIVLPGPLVSREWVTVMLRRRTFAQLSGELVVEVVVSYRESVGKKKPSQ
jgi:hypothetical protein